MESVAPGEEGLPHPHCLVCASVYHQDSHFYSGVLCKETCTRGCTRDKAVNIELEEHEFTQWLGPFFCEAASSQRRRQGGIQ